MICSNGQIFLMLVVQFHDFEGFCIMSKFLCGVYKIKVEKLF